MKMRKHSNIETLRGSIYRVPLTIVVGLLIERMPWLKPPSVFAPPPEFSVRQCNNKCAFYEYESAYIDGYMQEVIGRMQAT